MISKKGEGRYHWIAVFVVTVWGATFISTKLLLADGLSPAEIMFLRFLMAYAAIWFVAPKRVRSQSWRDEGIFLLLGVFGGSFYFQTENMALRDTLASNAALILCSAPLLTALLSHFFVRGGRLRKNTAWGSLLALSGVALVIFNGSFVLQLNPVGDALSIAAALSWAVYSILMRGMGRRYSTMFITRKVFFYGLVTLAPFLLLPGADYAPAALAVPAVWGNLLFLGFVASFVCFAVWNRVLKEIGVVASSNYIYLNPVFTMAAAVVVLGERITWIAVGGLLLIAAGLWLAETGTRPASKNIFRKNRTQ